MEENKERIEELERQIQEWQNELDTVWKDRNTDAAEVERRNLRNLISRSQKEIDELSGNATKEEIKPVEETLKDIKELKGRVEKEKKEISRDIRVLKNGLEKLEEEKKIYESRKNAEYKGIYEEYNKKIEEQKKEIEAKEKALKEVDEKMEKYYKENMDQILRSLTKGTTDIDKEIKGIEKQISEKRKEIEEIEYGTEGALEEVELADGTKTKIPKINRIYEDIKKLEEQIKGKQEAKQEIESLIKEVKGEKENTRTEFNAEQNAEVTKFFHGQGDIPENTRDDRRGNDEYFGFEGHGDQKTKSRNPGEEPGKGGPGGTKPTPPGPGESKGIWEIRDPNEPGGQGAAGGKEGPDGPNDPGGPGTAGGKGTPGELSTINSGLQQFRKQMNYIRDNYPIEDKHTITERMALPQAMAAVGGTALMALTPLSPAIGAGVIAASILSKPIAYRLTGQKKEEDKIVNQLRDMATNDKENFELMVDFLSEEKIQDIKPNAVFLRALHRVMLEETKDAKVELSERMKKLRDEQSKILKTKEERELNPEEKSRLKEINDNLDKIENVEAPNVQRRLKEIRRGKDRVSQRYKGNLATRLNIFAHRNSSSAMYDKPINELADAECVKLMGMRDGDEELRATGMRTMDETLQKHSTKGLLGVQNGVFNARIPNDPVRIISDKLDNTIKHAAMLGTFTIGTIASVMKMNEYADAQNINSAEHTRVVEEANKQGKTIERIQKEVSGFNKSGLSKETIQSAADGKVTQHSAYSEMTNYRKNFGDDTEYYKYDQQTQDEVKQMIGNKDVGNGDTASMLDKLAKMVDDIAHGSAKQYGQSLKDKQTVLDHSEQAGIIKDAESQTAAEAEIYRKLAEAFRRFGRIGKALENTPTKFDDNFVMVKESFIGPIVSAMGGVFGIGNDIKRNNDVKLPKELENDR